MKGVFKCTALAVALGLMGSSAAMADVVKGENIGNGYGTMTLHGALAAETCSVSVPKDDFTVSVTMATLKNSTENADLGSVNADLTLNHCQGTPVALKLTSANYDDQNFDIYPDGTTYGSAPFNAKLTLTKADGINWIDNGGVGAAYNGEALGLDGNTGIMLTPETDSSTFTLINTLRAGTESAVSSASPGDYKFTYTYNLTYL
ncbi:hypothetical protein M8W81_004685 [Salmonella enterica]|nr:hypothetical protein [Salmonella enterica]EJF6007257.1 hypothetical protein [Salmonella enterica]EJF6164714.1 hypothetical protein [Salmonella enterica]